MNDNSTDQSSDQEKQEKDDNKSHPPTVLGWAVRILSLVLILGLFAVIIWQATLEDEDVQFSVEVVTEEIRAQNDQFLIPVDITNEGSWPAQLVHIELTADAEPVEIEIPLIGHNETVRYVVNANSPTAQVEHRIISYEAP